jgi:hypothetical protein
MATASTSSNDGAKLGWFSLLFIFVLTSALPIFFGYFFSGMGYGLDTATKIVEYEDEASVALKIVGVLFVLGYFLDVHFWHPQHFSAKLFTSALVVVAIPSFVALSAHVPYWPICIFTITVPFFLLILKYIFFRAIPIGKYSNQTANLLIFQGLVLAAVFFAWMFTSGDPWDADTRAIYTYKAGCDADYTGKEYCRGSASISGKPCYFDDAPNRRMLQINEDDSVFNDRFEPAPIDKNATDGDGAPAPIDKNTTDGDGAPAPIDKNTTDGDGAPVDYLIPNFREACPIDCLSVYEHCSVAFILWVNPALAALSLIVIGCLVDYMLPKHPFNPNVQTVIKAVAAFLFIFWIFASLIGAGSGLSGSLIAFALAMMVGSIMIISAEIFLDTLSDVDPDELIEEAMEDAYEHTKSFVEIFQGILILAASPLLIAYIVLSVFKQVIRKLKSCCSGAPLQHTGILTEEASSHLDSFLHKWNHSNVLTIAFYTGVVYVCFSVLFAKFTTVFLSLLIEKTSSMDMITVTGIVTAVGMFLFMLPPVPGLPIYLTAGIVLISIGMPSLGMVGAILYATAVSLGIKLLACAVQQKLIGGLLGGSIGVKQAVAINSDTIRAMRLVLSDPGITFNKVAILVGGPDWPVSVLCGILGLDLLPILLGTIPVIFIIAPTVLTGSFTYIGHIETDDGREMYPWAGTMGTVSTSFAAGVMFFNTFAAAGAVASTVKDRKKEIDALDYDEDVKKADEESAKVAVFRKRVVVWSNVPIFFKLCLILSVLFMMACCYILVIFSKQSFRDYDLMFTIDEHLEGNWMNVVKPLGRKALLFFFVSIVFFQMFSMWASRETEKAMEASKSAESDALVQSSESKKGSYA